MVADTGNYALAIVARVRELRAGLDALGMSRNALVLGDDEAALMSDAPGSVAYPSAFVSGVAFVGLLAYFVKADLPMRLELTEYDAAGERTLQHCCVEPALDAQALALLRRIDPRRARDQEVSQQQAAEVLRALQASAGAAGFAADLRDI
jgi:hypothetical protein